MSRLIVVSNRVQAPSSEKDGAQGGLAVALQAALRDRGGLWFGWSGEVAGQFTGRIHRATSEGVTTAMKTSGGVAALWCDTVSP